MPHPLSFRPERRSRVVEKSSADVIADLTKISSLHFARSGLVVNRNDVDDLVWGVTTDELRGVR